MASPKGQRLLLPTSYSAPDNAINRPPSSASRRPGTSASIRPSSSLSNRPISRLSHHAQTRQVRSRLIPLCQSLVAQTTGLHEDDEHFQALVDSVFQRLESTSQIRSATVADFKVINKRMNGFIQRAKVDVHDTLAEALSAAYSRLKAQAPLLNDVDERIKSFHLPHHMQLLIELSTPASQSSLAYARLYLHNLHNPPPPPLALTWEEILAEEPFTGEHWEGLGKLHRDPEDGSISSPSLSDWSSDGEYEQHFGHSESSVHSEEDTRELQESVELGGGSSLGGKLAARELLEELQARQYWRGRPASLGHNKFGFDLGDHSTLSYSLQAAVRTRNDVDTIQDLGPWIKEQDAVREVLMVLQGRDSMLFDGPSKDDPRIEVASTCPRFLHLSLTSQHSLLSSFATFAAVVTSLRHFSTRILDQSISPHFHNARTTEAFADAVANEIQLLDRWVAHREELIAGACAGTSSEDSSGNVVSLLNIENAVRNSFGDVFDALHQIVLQIQSRGKGTAASTATLLLDLLTHGLEQQRLLGNDVGAEALFRVFVHTVEPLWSMVGTWLKDGMKADDHADELDDEFFVQKTALSNPSNLFDTDFWDEGYVLRHTGGQNPVNTSPAFMLHVAQTILQSGKTTGLLRLLDAPSLGQIEVVWPSFQDLLSSQTEGHSSISSTGNHLSHLVSEKINNHYALAGTALVDFLINECDMWQHIQTIEDIYFLRKGDAMTDFTSVLFSKMDASQDWGDFHFLNSSFRDVVEYHAHRWVDVGLVRLSYRSARERSIHKTVNALNGFAIEYAVPFPLTYVFSGVALDKYGEVLVFLLQLKRSKHVLERILVRSHCASAARGQEAHLKILYSLRSRLSWFISTILNFVLTYVIHAEVLRFHSALRQASSLDEILRLHGDHLDVITGRCLLQKQTSALHRAILSALDMALQFSELFVSIAGDTTSDHNQSLSLKTRKRRRHFRRNIVGFAPPDPIHESESESDDEFQAEVIERTLETSMLPPYASENWTAQIEKMSSDLDGLVRFVRRGTETLAAGPSSAASAFGALTFALEDWDI